MFCLSESNLKIPIWYASSIKKSNDKKPLILFTGRQHAFESPTSFVLEGLVDFLISNDKSANKLLDQFDFKIVPMFDVDNVKNGGSGKDQLPRDFNRDWSDDTSHYYVVAKYKLFIDSIIKNQQVAGFIDFHSPYPMHNSKDKKGELRIALSHYYNPFVGQNNRLENRVDKLFEIYSKISDDEMYKEGNNNRVKKGERTIRNFIANKLMQNNSQPDSIFFITTFEQPWDFDVNGKIYDRQHLLNNGKDIGLSIFKFINEK